MTTEQAIKLMLVEATCIERASNIDHPCTRECEKCDLLQKSEDLFSAYGMAVSALRSQQWISVKDRLPVRPEDTFHDGHWWMTSGEDFIVSDSDGKVFEAHWTYGCSCQNYFWYENSLIPLTNITHWMPLPEPPKEAQK